MKILLHSNSRDAEYEEYLTNHIGNVQLVWSEILRPAVVGDLDSNIISKIDKLIDEHDKSKYSDEEWEGYLDNFYPDEANPKPQDEVDLAFKYAWLHHLHANPHHWNYWVLLEDEGTGVPEPIDMPVEHVICMPADWSSFRYGSDDNPGKDGDADTTRGWYESNTSNHVMTDKTKDLIEKYIDLLP